MLLSLSAYKVLQGFVGPNTHLLIILSRIYSSCRLSSFATGEQLNLVLRLSLRNLFRGSRKPDNSIPSSYYCSLTTCRGILFGYILTLTQVNVHWIWSLFCYAQSSGNMRPYFGPWGGKKLYICTGSYTPFRKQLSVLTNM